MVTRLKLTLRNLNRNIKRTTITVLIIAIAVTALIFFNSMLDGLLFNLSHNLIKTDLGEIKIADRRYLQQEHTNPLKYAIKGADEIEKYIADFSDIVSIQPRLKFSVLLEHHGNSEFSVGTGIDPEREINNLLAVDNIIEGRLFKLDAQEAIIGSQLAEKLDLHVGDSLFVVARTLYFSLDAMAFEIAGIFETGLRIVDEKQFFIPIGKAQFLLDADNTVSNFVITLNNSNDAKQISEAINKKFASYQSIAMQIIAVPWQQNKFIRTIEPYLKKATIVSYAIVMFIAGFVVLNTLLISLMEQTQQIVIMKTMGTKNFLIIAPLILEAFAITFVSCLLGIVIGGTFSIWAESHSVHFSATLKQLSLSLPFINAKVYTDFTFGSAWSVFTCCIIMTIAALIYPCVKAIQVDPAEAIRKI